MNKTIGQLDPVELPLQDDDVLVVFRGKKTYKIRFSDLLESINPKEQ